MRSTVSAAAGGATMKQVSVSAAARMPHARESVRPTMTILPHDGPPRAAVSTPNDSLILRIIA
jgi:hypothetical protein